MTHSTEAQGHSPSTKLRILRNRRMRYSNYDHRSAGIFDLVIALFVVSVALAAMAISYSQMLKKFNAYQKEADEMMSQVHTRESDLLEDGRIKAGKIVEDANKSCSDNWRKQ